jgi:hypothetical protein
LHFLDRLELLDLAHTAVNDDALRKLVFANRLEELWLQGTLVISAGIRTFERIRPECLIHLEP